MPGLRQKGRIVRRRGFSAICYTAHDQLAQAFLLVDTPIRNHSRVRSKGRGILDFVNRQRIGIAILSLGTRFQFQGAGVELCSSSGLTLWATSQFHGAHSVGDFVPAFGKALKRCDVQVSTFWGLRFFTSNLSWRTFCSVSCTPNHRSRSLSRLSNFIRWFEVERRSHANPGGYLWHSRVLGSASRGSCEQRI
jgi:hypothetical protein